MKLGLNQYVLTMIGAVSIAAASCAKKENHGSGEPVNQVKVMKQNSAEELARAGEKLMTPWSFMYADQIFTEALNKDPKNQLAQFYKSALEPLIASRGIMNRVRPLMAKLGTKQAADHEHAISFLKGDVASFFLDGPQDITDEKTAQDYIASVASSLDHWRTFLRNNKDMELKLNLPNLKVVPKSVYQNTCTTYKNSVGDVTYYDTYCSNSYSEYEVVVGEGSINVEIQRADIEVIQNEVAYMQLIPMVYSSYSATGFLETAKSFEGRANVTDKETFEALSKLPAFGKLRADNQLGKAVEIGSDFIQALKWTIQNQGSICKTGKESSGNRPGTLVSRGICLDKNGDNSEYSLKKAIEVIKAGEAALSGPFDAIYAAKDGSKKFVTINAPRFLQSPLLDLRAIYPQTFNSCGNAVGGISDNSVNGLFSNADFEGMLTNEGKLGKSCEINK